MMIGVKTDKKKGEAEKAFVKYGLRGRGIQDSTLNETP